MKKIEVSSSSEEEELSEVYEYVMEDLPQETAVFGPSRPLKSENLDGTGIRLAKTITHLSLMSISESYSRTLTVQN